MGRKSTEEEVQDWLRQHGKQLDDFPDLGLETPDPLTMLEEFRTEAYRQMKAGELKGSNLANVLRLIDKMAEDYKATLPPTDVVEEKGIEEILADLGLPAKRRIELGREEIRRLRERESALQLLVARLEGEQ